MLALAAVALLTRGGVRAQVGDRRPKVAILSPNTFDHGRLPGSVLNSFVSGLAEIGYVDGQNVSFEFRFADDALERLPALAAELVGTRPDVIWT